MNMIAETFQCRDYEYSLLGTVQWFLSCFFVLLLHDKYGLCSLLPVAYLKKRVLKHI